MDDFNDFKRIFGTNIRKYREDANLSQEQLAELIGKSVVFLSQLENGHYGTKFETIFKLSRILKVEPYQFFIEHK